MKCSLLFIDHHLGKLCIKGHLGIEESFVKENVLKMGDGIDTLAESCHKTKILKDPFSQTSAKIDGTPYQSEMFLSVPVQSRDHTLGIMNVSHKNGKDGGIFTGLDYKILLMIVRQVRIAIENAKMYRELKHLTITDPLTEIYNYHYFTQTLDHEIIRSKRYQRDLSLLMIDVDKFKTYNDIFGHVEGDMLLKNIASAIKRNMRKADIVCRYGGDEFAVILPETNLIQARKIAGKIIQKVSELALQQTVSVGIGVAQADPKMNRYDLARKADSNLYEAKHHGRNQISG